MAARFTMAERAVQLRCERSRQNCETATRVIENCNACGAVAGLALSPLPDGPVALRCGPGRAFDELLAVDDKMGLCAALASARRAEVHAAVGAEDAALLGIATDVPLDVSERFAFRPAANARAEVHARANEGGVSVRIRLLGEGHADQPAESAQETRHEGRRRDA